ncbi:RNA polymerase sigma factor RpoD/SigA [bacterium]|nr:RNA polymerase sigma factor RpoD/SigA [bacterium]
MKSKNTSAPINQEEVQHYLKDIRKIKVMTPERERELSKLMCSDMLDDVEIEKINQEILQGNLRFVITIAKQYQNQGLDLSDLIAEGNLGLMKAIKNFDWTKKLRFISYAVWWVKQSILQSLNDNSRTIRLPVNVVQDLFKEKREIEKTGKQLSARFASLPNIIDLDRNINDEGDTLVDIIKNPDADMPDEGLMGKDMLKQKLLSLLNVLDERERMIVIDYFGMDGCNRTLEDIGEDFNLTKERVRQIKQKALRKLRNESSVLFDYM